MEVDRKEEGWRSMLRRKRELSGHEQDARAEGLVGSLGDVAGWCFADLHRERLLIPNMQDDLVCCVGAASERWTDISSFFLRKRAGFSRSALFDLFSGKQVSRMLGEFVETAKVREEMYADDDIFHRSASNNVYGDSVSPCCAPRCYRTHGHCAYCAARSTFERFRERTGFYIDDSDFCVLLEVAPL